MPTDSVPGLPFRWTDRPGRRASIDAADPAFFQDPYPVYEALREAGPSFYWEEQGRWCFLGAAEVSALLRDRNFGREYLNAEPPPPGRCPAFDRFQRNSLLEREPPTHTRLRSLVNKAFLGRSIERLRPRITALAHELVDGFAGRGETELLAGYAAPIPVTVIAELLGVPAERAPDLLDWSHRMVAMYQLVRTPQVESSAEAATVEFSDFLREHVRERRLRPGDDLISLLVAAEADGERLSEEELIGTCILLLNAGHEATVHTLGNSVKAILESAADPAALFASPDATERAVEECLRYDPPLHLFARYVQADARVGDVELRAGEAVALLYGAANRDPARFADAAGFDPARAVAPAFGFGGGIHFCLGAPLARMELQLSLPVLFQRLRGLRLLERPRYRDGYPFHGLEKLLLAWDR
jgi:cytochrome P450